MKKLCAALMLSALSVATAAAETGRDWMQEGISTLCPAPALTGFDAQLALPGAWLLEEEFWPDPANPASARVTLALPGGATLVLERRQAGGALRQFRAAYSTSDADGASRPRLQAIADGGCVIRAGREIRQGQDGWVHMDQLEGDLTTLRWTETLQAPWPPGRDPGGVRVALVDSGLAYDLPIFRERLARGLDGLPLGYDYWDMDPLPYDGDTSRGAFFPIRHGTTVASLLVSEAPEAALIPYRYPRPDMNRLGDLVAAAAGAGARILAMPLGSNRPGDWDRFAEELAARDMLAIVSAGNDGRDIDSRPVYPAALDLPNIVVVTSADGFGRLAEGSNWGAASVDLMVPAENLPVTDFRGATGSASGSSYAVPRVAALAARLLAAEPGLSALDLRDKLYALAKPSPFTRDGAVAVGWIADPAAAP